MDYAHGQGLIHRDIKPANIMLSDRGQAVLMDFGVAKILGGKPRAGEGSAEDRLVDHRRRRGGCAVLVGGGQCRSGRSSCTAAAIWRADRNTGGGDHLLGRFRQCGRRLANLVGTKWLG
jgi:serine/threonine protein kinase